MRSERSASSRKREFVHWMSDFIELIQNPHGASPTTLVMLDVLNQDLRTARNVGCGVHLFTVERPGRQA